MEINPYDSRFKQDSDCKGLVFPLFGKRGLGNLPRRSILRPPQYLTETEEYAARVLADSGTVHSMDLTNDLYKFYLNNGLLNDLLFLWAAENGYKIANPADVLKRLSEGYSLIDEYFDWAQAVVANQPYLSGNIAPNELQCISNQQGTNRYAALPNIISFAYTEDWTLTFVVNAEGTSTINSFNIYQSYSSGTSLRAIYLPTASSNTIKVAIGTTINSFTLPSRIEGKTTIISISHLYDSRAPVKKYLSLYVNGELIEKKEVTSMSFVFSSILIDANSLSGKIYHHEITGARLTVAQVQAQHTFLRTIYPQVETVQIGTQHWATSNFDAVVTPMGTEIQQVTLAVNMERITNAADRDFSSDTGWWTKLGATNFKTYPPQVVDDWYLPSIDELQQMRTALHLTEIRPFSTSVLFWSSTQNPSEATEAKSLNFGTGAVSNDYVLSENAYCPIRHFITQDQYNIGDWGEYGCIFYIDEFEPGNFKCYEACDNEFYDVIWTDSGVSMLGTGSAIGTGENNTSLIVAYDDTGAAGLCYDYEIVIVPESKVCNIYSTTAVESVIRRDSLLTNGKWHKLTYTVTKNTSGTLRLYHGSGYTTLNSAVGTYSVYFQATGTQFNIANTNDVVDIDIDNVSLNEVGWTGLSALADSEGNAAAAAWQYYNNDAANGAIYGKLYNGYAAKQIQDDIDAWNNANPSNLWGYHLPSYDEFTALSTELGGNSVSGGKLKMTGTDFIESPNTGASNSSGFTALAGGLISSALGVGSSLKQSGRYWSTLIGGSTGYYMSIFSTSAAVNISASNLMNGYSLRLIKD